MKFSKILLIVGAFAFIGLTLSIQRSERTEAQYQATTQTLRVEVGYKELLTPPDGEFSEKVLERDYKGIVTYKDKQTEDFVLQASMLKEGAFRSGIPFFTSNPVKFSTPGFSQIFLPITGQNKVQFVPFVQLTQACQFDIANLPLKMTCPVRTSVGAGILGFEFADVMDTEALTIVNQINKLKIYRETEINRTIVGVLDAISRLKAKQQELADVAARAVADAFKKQSEKQNLIIQLIRKQGEIDDQITSEGNKYRGLTANVEKINKKISEINLKISALQSSKVTLISQTITLRKNIAPEARIAKMESDLQRYVQLINYWVQGAVFHRIIDDKEANPLIEMAKNAQSDAFNAKVDDYFFPQ